MALIDPKLPKQYKNTKVLFEQNLDAWRKAAEAALATLNLNLAQIGKDVKGNFYDFSNTGAQSIFPDLQTQINNLASGATPITGTTSDTWSINTDGFTGIIDTINLTAIRTFRFPDIGGSSFVVTEGNQTVNGVKTFTGNLKVTTGSDLQLYSDAGITLKASIDGATGNISTLGDILINSGSDLKLYSDAGITLKASIDGATGNALLQGTLDVIGNVTFDSPTFFVDVATHQVQIGTIGSSPGLTKLYVKNDANPPAIFERNAAGGVHASIFYNPDTTDGNTFYLAARSDTTGAGAAAYTEFASIRFGFDIHDHATRSGSTRFFTTANGTSAERGRFDLSGNLLIGRTTANSITPTHLDVLSTGGELAMWESTSSGASGVNLYTYANSSSPAASDNIAIWSMRGNSSTGVQRELGRIHLDYTTTTNGSEVTELRSYVMRSGTITNVVTAKANSFQLESGVELEMPAIDPPTANMGNSNSLVRAWANIDDAGNILASYNVVLVEHLAVGQYRVHWDTNFSSSNYACVATPEGADTDMVCTIPTKTSSNTLVYTYDTSGAAFDDSEFSVIAIGVQ